MNDPLKKNANFVWTDECENAFNESKGRVTKAPILRYPQYEKEFYLSADSSEYSIGFVLSKEHDGKLHPVLRQKQELALLEGV